MALVLGLKIEDSFSAAGDIFTLLENGVKNFVLQRNSDQKTFKVTDEKMTEIIKDVFVSCGSLKQEKVTRVVIEAPREIKIKFLKKVSSEDKQCGTYD